MRVKKLLINCVSSAQKYVSIIGPAQILCLYVPWQTYIPVSLGESNGRVRMFPLKGIRFVLFWVTKYHDGGVLDGGLLDTHII